MDIKELLGFLECEKMERFQKVDSSVKGLPRFCCRKTSEAQFL